MPDLSNFSADLIRARQITLALYYALLVYFAINSFLALGPSAALPVVWSIQTVALLLFLPGLHQGKARSYAWMSFVVLLYFVHGVLLAFDAQRRWLGLTETVLCVLLFTSLIIYIRRYRAHFQVPI